jgi:hypothetical protein
MTQDHLVGFVVGLGTAFAAFIALGWVFTHYVLRDEERER